MSDVPVLSDQEIDRVPLEVLDRAIRRHLIADASGEAVSPARMRVAFSKGDLVFTTGGGGSIAGFRVYETFRSPERLAEDQIVAVWNQDTCRLKGIALGRRLGAVRTGVIGGVAVDAMAAPDAKLCGVIGTGLQAETQLNAILALRNVAEVRVFSRDETNRSKFATRFGPRTSAVVREVKTAEECVADAEIVVLATNSRTPVIDPAWLASDVHVTTVGPKSKAAHELPVAWAEKAGVIASDSPQQIASQGDQHMLPESTRDRIVHLGQFAGGVDPVPRRGPTLFLSAGLAGTEVAALDAALAYLAEIDVD